MRKPGKDQADAGKTHSECAQSAFRVYSRLLNKGRNLKFDNIKNNFHKKKSDFWQA